MKLAACLLIGSLFAIACSSSSSSSNQKAKNAGEEVSYETHPNKGTTVVVHPPAPIVGTTRTTSAELRVNNKDRDRDIPVTSLEHRQDAPGYGNADTRMTWNVRQAIAADDTLRDISMERVRITTVNSRVSLTGYVPTIADKIAIEQRVREVRGVEGVDNEIQVLH